MSTEIRNETPLEREYSAPVDLGEMVYVNLGQSAAIQKNAAGENEVYFISNGSPGTFFALDAESGKLKYKEVIPNTVATWAMAIGSDQNVYFASTEDGNLYRYLPLERKVELIGHNETDNWTWDLAAIGDKLYGGTFNNSTDGKVYEYDIAKGTFRNYGAVDAGRNYVRGVGVDERYIYAGLGTDVSKLVKIDRMTGEKAEIAIPGYTGIAGGSIQGITIRHRKMFVAVTASKMIVRDMDTGEIDGEIHCSNYISEPAPWNGNVVYFKHVTEFFQYDMNTKETTKIELPVQLPDTARVKAMAWIGLTSGPKAGVTVLALVTQHAEYILIDPRDGWVSSIALEIEAQPVGIQALKCGPDGRLYMGGYQRGMSIYNPVAKQIEVNLPTFAQPEGIGFLDGYVYYGTYVGAVMYRYDPAKPPSHNENPKRVFTIEHQDRPFAITSGDGKLFAGTVPDYGMLGGALAVYDAATDMWKQYNHEALVRNQSIMSLAYKDGLLYGSTTVWGGLGIAPSEKEAKIFIWDVAQERKVGELSLDGLNIDQTPRMISIAFGPDGLLWGVVEGTIFAIDVTTKQIVKQRMIRPSLYNMSKWLPYELEWGPDGLLYTTLARKLFAIDPGTLQYQVVYDDIVTLMAIGADGSIYFSANEQRSKLFRIAPTGA